MESARANYVEAAARERMGSNGMKRHGMGWERMRCDGSSRVVRCAAALLSCCAPASLPATERSGSLYEPRRRSRRRYAQLHSGEGAVPVAVAGASEPPTAYAQLCGARANANAFASALLRLRHTHTLTYCTCLCIVFAYSMRVCRPPPSSRGPKALVDVTTGRLGGDAGCGGNGMMESDGMERNGRAAEAVGSLRVASRVVLT